MHHNRETIKQKLFNTCSVYRGPSAVHEPKASVACDSIFRQQGENMIDKAMLAKVRDDIREAGYQYACLQYYSGQSSHAFRDTFKEWEEDVTKQTLNEHFYEAACHEGLQTDVWEAFEAKGSEYVDCLDEISELFCEGGSRRIDEILRDA